MGAVVLPIRSSAKGNLEGTCCPLVTSSAGGKSHSSALMLGSALGVMEEPSSRPSEGLVQEFLVEQQSKLVAQGSTVFCRDPERGKAEIAAGCGKLTLKEGQ